MSAAPTLTLRQLNRTTLLRQSLLARSPWTAAEAVGRLAGLQAQHANSPYVALWSRVEGFSIESLQAALRDRTVVKGTLMRATLHLVAAADLPAFDAGLREGRTANWRPTARRAGVEIEDLHRDLLAFAREPRSVAEMEAFLETLPGGDRIAERAPGGVRGVAFRVASAPGRLVHVPPSGMWGSFAKPRYIDLGVWLPGAITPDAADALRLAVERYLTAYGPASIADVAKWFGATRITAVRAVVAALGDRVTRFIGPDGRDLIDLAGLPLATGDEDPPNRFLARWDSIVIGYDRRERILADEHFGRVVRIKNGDFLPTFTVDGFIAGTWGVEIVRGEAVLTMQAVAPVPAAARVALTDEAERLVRFVAADATRHEVRWADG
jgi:Winged helix DNA-binding domain